MLKKTLVLCAFIASSFAVNSQIEIVGGLNMSNESFKSDGEKIDNETKMNPGVNLGVLYRIELSNNLHFLPGLVLDTRGSKYVSGSSTSKTNLNYLTIPVNLRMHFDVSSNVKAFLNLSPYAGVAVSGSDRYKDDDSSSKESVEFKDEYDYSRLDYGLNFGLGVDLDKFSVCAGYDLGLANTTRVSSDSNFKSNNSTLKLTIGYKL